MRIVGGELRGRRFEAPEGRNTRPTTDRMRETIASMVLSACDLDLEGHVVLDAFAGSGGVGLELLSRGATSCTFCERDRRTAGLVRRNCTVLGLPTSSWRVVAGDVCRLAVSGRIAGSPFSLVFLDPPYAMATDDVARLVADLSGAGLLSPRALVVYERSSEAPELAVPGFSLLRSRTHGGTAVDILQQEG